MNQQFEALPFELEGGMEGEEGEWAGGMEYERGGRRMSAPRGVARGGGQGGRAGGKGAGRSGGRIVASRPAAIGAGAGRGGRVVPVRGGKRPGKVFVPPRGPRPVPWPAWPYYYGPRYGGPWPYAAVTVQTPEPDGWSDAAQPPDDTPVFDDGSGDGQDFAAPESAEVPPTIAAAIARLPAAQRPAYVALGPITAALRDSRATGPGFYLIEFTVNGVQRAYSGQTGNLRRRLQQHALCGQMMGLPLASHSVYVAQSGLPEPQRRAVEYRIHDDMFRTAAGVLTNQRRELEAELFGHEWR